MTRLRRMTSAHAINDGAARHDWKPPVISSLKRSEVIASLRMARLRRMTSAHAINDGAARHDWKPIVISSSKRSEVISSLWP